MGLWLAVASPSELELVLSSHTQKLAQKDPPNIIVLISHPIRSLVVLISLLLFFLSLFTCTSCFKLDVPLQHLLFNRMPMALGQQSLEPKRLCGTKVGRSRFKLLCTV